MGSPELQDLTVRRKPRLSPLGFNISMDFDNFRAEKASETEMMRTAYPDEAGRQSDIARNANEIPIAPPIILRMASKTRA
jgi:hypothetical protein